MVQHPLWRAFYEKLNFKLPSRKTLATKYLDTLYNEMFKELCDDLKKATFLHLQCDGWSNIRNQGVINFLISKPEMVFVKSLDTEDHRHTSEYLCSEIEKVMKSYGEQKFVVLIGDNARNLQKAFQMLQIKYPSIVPLGCAAHSLNLLCADAMKLHVIKACIDLATDVIKCVKRSQVLSALLFKIRKDKNIHGETLKLPCKTRWGSYVSALKSVETNKVALQTLAVNEHIQPSTEIKATILDENFWIMVNQCVNVLKPITESIFQLEGNDYNINKVFMVLKNIKSKLQFNLATTSILENADKELLMTAVENRIAQVIKPIHLAAHLLDPIAVGQELDQNQEIDAMEFINDLANSLNIDCVADLAQYKGRGGLWSKQFTWKAAESVDPVMWWRGICGSTALSKIAVRILTAPCTSAVTERSFSTHSFIHSVKRNRLTTERAAKISFLVYWNLLYRDCVLDDHASSDGDIYVEHTSDLTRKCLKCGCSPREDPDIKLYRLPNPGPTNTKRCELWVKYCFPEGPWSSVDFQRKLYGEHRMLCNQHFKKSSFTNFAEKKLNRHAVPDITNTENQPTIEFLSFSAEQPVKSHLSTNVIPQTLQRELANVTNIQKAKVSVSNILQDTSKDEPQAGPSGVSNKNTKKLDSELVTVCDIQTATIKKNDVVYKKYRNYMKKVCQLKNKIKHLKKTNVLNVIHNNEAIQNLIKHVTPSLALMLQGELKNAKRKYTGRRWTSEQKIIALRLYKRSPATYHLLRRLWCLPAPSTLKNILRNFHLTVGINEKVFKTLKKYSLTQDPINNEYVLMFDEMSIKKHLFYNIKEDKVEGYQDHGNHGRSPHEATHALVFMVAGIRKKKKQPVAFYLSSSNVTADRLSVLIKEVLSQCFESGINIAATVCDMGGVNRRALTVLGASKEAPFITFKCHEVVTLFDSPHLLKCFRNMFLKYNIRCKTNITSNNVAGQGLAKWNHIEMFYEIDNDGRNFVFAPKSLES
ncbi:hypothetical protein evm_013452 [Chilo suppressalis]|nr:hypothetical protein evm_013452 [Chilo suppressalis]